MKKLKRNASVKTIALFLQALFVTLTISLALWISALNGYGAYDAGCLTDCGLADEVMDFDCSVLADPLYIGDIERMVEFQMKYPMERNGEPVCNTAVSVTSADGYVLLKNYEAEVIPSTVCKLTLSCGIGIDEQSLFEFSPGHNNPVSYMSYLSMGSGEAYEVEFAEWLFTERGINSYDMTRDEVLERYWDLYSDDYYLYLYGTEYNTVPYAWYNVTLGVAKDSVEILSREYMLIKGFEHRAALPVLAAICGAVSLLLAVFLAISAGWRSEGDKPVATAVERIPLELFLGLAAAACVLIGHLLLRPVSGAEETSVLSKLVQALAVYAIVFIAVASVHSLLARFKCVGWTKNTLVCRVANLIGWTARNISDVGRVLVWGAVWLIVNLVLLAVIADHAALGLLLMALFNTVFVVAAAAIAAQWQRLRDSAAIIANGDTSHRVDTKKMLPPLRMHGESINRMGEGVAAAVEEQMKSERMKTDLITNVSHDLKTPLTSIVSYVGLLKNEDIDSRTAKEYIGVLDRQATRLARLIEDLVEASKATSGNVRVQLENINISELLEQAVSEYEMRLEQSSVTSVLSVSASRLMAVADGRLLWRVFDNLLSNVCKYGLAGTRLYIDAAEQDGSVTVTFRNVSADRLNIPAEELMERFVRGDSSRTTSGSGLGLTIARSLTELQNGKFNIEIEGDMFKVFVVLPAAESVSEEE